MSIKLKNEFLSLDIQEPSECYTGSRFDWTGKITQITFLNKHTFCTTETRDKSLINRGGRGLYNEFGLDRPLGYEECPINGEFPKIGVGLLTRKSGKPYNFFEEYQVKPYSFSYSVYNTKAEFICESHKNHEYSFKLEKKIELIQNNFSIEYSLINNGKKEIRTNEYVHNFLSINHNPVNQNYLLKFSFPLIPEKMKKIVNPGKAVKIKGNSITWEPGIETQFFFGELNAGYDGTGKWMLIYNKENVGIEESGSFKIEKINLWGDKHVVSPEIFFEINLAPGKNIQWTRNYTVFIHE